MKNSVSLENKNLKETCAKLYNNMNMNDHKNNVNYLYMSIPGGIELQKSFLSIQTMIRVLISGAWAAFWLSYCILLRKIKWLLIIINQIEFCFKAILVFHCHPEKKGNKQNKLIKYKKYARKYNFPILWISNF